MTETTAQTVIQEFIDQDTEWLAEMVEKYPRQIPIPILAEKFGCDENTIRENLESKGLLGISERKPGKVNRGFVVPTAHFVRWYMCEWHF